MTRLLSSWASRAMTLVLMLFSYLSPLLAQDVTFDEMTYTPAATTFSLFAPDTVSAAVVRLYADALSPLPLRTIPLQHVGAARYTTTVAGDLQGLFYTFDIGRGETAGVFAKAVGVNGTRAAIVDLRASDPVGWQDDRQHVSAKAPCDRVIYELHHRDFSIDASSGLTHRGKYLALTEPPALAHLVALGINTVHLLPSFDFASVDERRAAAAVPQYNWGYDPLNYNVPEGSYATDPYDPLVRIREFKQMVQALHKADIDVVLDVVYNHTYDIEGSGFQRTYPDYFYRQQRDGTYSDGSGCGNETASEREAMRAFMLASMAYWMDEYHVDGFRVDLMGIHDIETMNILYDSLQARFGRVFIYGEGWTAGDCAYPEEQRAVKSNMSRLPHIAAFGDELRDALRGPYDDDTQGAFLAGLTEVRGDGKNASTTMSIKYGIVGAIEHPQIDMTQVNYASTPWATEPSQMIAYVSCHDDMCLADRLRASIPSLCDDSEVLRLALLAQTAVLTSQGIPFLLSGEELLRTKQGVHNSYNSPDSINHLDWTNKERYPQAYDYLARLIALRRQHPAFRLGSAAAIREHLTFLPTDDTVVAFCLAGHAGGDTWDNIYVVLNASNVPQTITVPAGHYTVVCRDGQIAADGIDSVEGSSITVPRRSALIAHD